jgi:alkanesulfonate monooxygenase SsuD/methylene tetrahydromethanopterin reductase-like flavin-dependent oxidoreductase (luciferase family)
VRFGVGLFSLGNTAMMPLHWAYAYREMREHAALMEELGFDELWLSQHNFYYDGYCPSLLPAAASVLSVTERLRVGTGMLIASLPDPQRLVTVARDLNRRSGDRLDVGMVVGYRDIEFDGHGVSRRHRGQRLLAALEAMEDAEGHGGATVWIGGQTDVAIRRAGSRAHPILLSAALPFERCAYMAQIHEEAWVQAGRPGATKPGVSALRNIWISDDPDERAAGLDYVRASYVQYAGLGWTLPAAGEHEEQDYVTEMGKAIQASVDTTITGGPDDVIRELRDLEALGMDQIVFRLMLDGAPRAAVEHQMRRLATEVLPHLQAGARA